MALPSMQLATWSDRVRWAMSGFNNQYQSIFIVSIAAACAVFSLISTILLAFRYLGENSPDYHRSVEPTVLVRDQLLTLIQALSVLGISGTALLLGRLILRFVLPTKRPSTVFLGVTELYVTLLLTFGLGLLVILNFSYLSKARSLGKTRSLFVGQLILLACGVCGIWLLMSLTFLTWPELRTERWLPIASTGSAVACITTSLFTLYSYTFPRTDIQPSRKPLALDYHDFALARLIKYAVGLALFCSLTGAFSLATEEIRLILFNTVGLGFILIFSYCVAELIEGSFIAPPRTPSSAVHYIRLVQKGVAIALVATAVVAFVLLSPARFWGGSDNTFIDSVNRFVAFAWILSIPTTILFASANARVFSASFLSRRRIKLLNREARAISALSIASTLLVLIGQVASIFSSTVIGLTFGFCAIAGIYLITRAFLKGLKGVVPTDRRRDFISHFASPVLSKLPSIFLYETAVEICADQFPQASSTQLLSMMEQMNLIEFSVFHEDRVGNITSRGVKAALEFANQEEPLPQKITVP